MQPPLQTRDDSMLVKRYVLLPVLLDVLEKNIALLESSGKLPEPLIGHLRLIQDRVTADMAFLRKQFRRRGIRIYEERRTTDGLNVAYICRGYHHRFSLLWRLIRAEIVTALEVYLDPTAGPDTGNTGQANITGC
ncbi:hypothetical protein ACI48J_09360 [Paenibacillus chitinolyticus]|uniref:hypothetical protein n=1 Tax=Paenibacillus chitinolyticus TaxID=79263 RepID=UPI003863C8BA